MLALHARRGVCYNVVVSDPGRPPVVPIPAASVLLLRERAGGGGVELFLVRRHRKSAFMSDAFVFPGGKIDPDDGGAEVAAVRELFEEAGVLLATPPLDGARQAEWRARLNARQATLRELLAAEGLTLDVARLRYWARWITPSVEPRRFDAQFYLAELPPGQEPSFDQKETVDSVWVTPGEALEQQSAGNLKLPPPQIRTMLELLPDAPHGVARLFETADRRREHPHPVMPRFAQVEGLLSLLLPWDPEYETLGAGESTPMPRGHLLATGPSRFILRGPVWSLEYATLLA